jgi:photosystem II stability/assembly factor-like uncharacterized protein
MPITGIKFIDITKGWAVTGNLTSPVPSDTSSVINTINGGTNWIEQLRAPATEFTDLEVVDGNNINVSGYDLNINRMIIYKSTNGGINWSSITMVPNMLINDMQFLNKDSAWECGSSAGPDVRTTTDGGNTWVVRTNGILSATQRIFFLNYNTGFCGANNNVLYKTTNAGLNWFPNGTFTQIVQSICFLNNNTGWVGLSSDTTSLISYTSNGGANWILQRLMPYITNISDIHFLNAQTGWAGIGSIAIYKTTNSGINWGFQNNLSQSVRISFVDTLKGWTGRIGISKTTNGGGPIFYLGFTPEGTNIPKNFTLYQNYPNPFNPYTTIKLDISESSVIKLYISDILGRVHYEVINQFLVPGKYEFNWDSRYYSSGVYFYTLISDKFTETKKMLLIK